MKMSINDYENLVIIASPKSIRVNLPVNVKHNIKFIVRQNGSSAKYTKKKEISHSLFKCKLGYEHKHKKTKPFIKSLNHL